MGFHIHTQTHAHTFPLTHVLHEADFDLSIVHTWKVYCELKWDFDSVPVQFGITCRYKDYMNTYCNDCPVIMHFLKWSSSSLVCVKLCETPSLSCERADPFCASTAEEWALEEDQKRKRKAIEFVNVIYERAQCGLVVLRSMSFPTHRTHKNTSICIVLCGLACITFFSTVLKISTDWFFSYLHMCTSVQHNKMSFSIILPCC